MELTARALGAGVGIGVVLAVANTYMSLKTGWIDSGNVTAAVLGFACFAGRRRRYGALENNITQATATAAGALSFTAGLAAAFPALALLGQEVPAPALTAWGAMLALFGTTLAARWRHRLLDVEALPFPTGRATAEVIEVMHRSSAAALGRARALGLSALAAAAVTWLRDARPRLVPAASLLPGRIAGTPLDALGLGVAWSPLMLATGLLVGPHLGLSLVLGAAVAWAGLGPRLVAGGVVAGADYGSLVAWLLWPGVALMLASTATTLVVEWRALGRALGWRRPAAVEVAPAPAPSYDELPARLASVTLAVAALALLAIGRWWLHLPPAFTLLALAASVVLGHVAVRAAGQTDVDPVGSFAQLTQVGYGALAPGQHAVNLGGAGLVAGGITQLVQATETFKTGQLLGASPRRQWLAMAVGALAGAGVSVPAYVLLRRAWPLGSPELPAPSALAWKALAQAVAGGAASLPPHAGVAVVAALGLGVALTLAGRTRWRRALPSPVAMGVGFLVPASFAAAICAGGLLAALVAWRRRAFAERYLAACAAGAIAGEALLGVAIAALAACGLVRI